MCYGIGTQNDTGHLVLKVTSQGAKTAQHQLLAPQPLPTLQGVQLSAAPEGCEVPRPQGTQM